MCKAAGTARLQHDDEESDKKLAISSVEENVNVDSCRKFQSQCATMVVPQVPTAPGPPKHRVRPQSRSKRLAKKGAKVSDGLAQTLGSSSDAAQIGDKISDVGAAAAWTKTSDAHSKRPHTVPKVNLQAVSRQAYGDSQQNPMNGQSSDGARKLSVSQVTSALLRDGEPRLTPRKPPTPRTARSKVLAQTAPETDACAGSSSSSRSIAASVSPCSPHPPHDRSSSGAGSSRRKNKSPPAKPQVASARSAEAGRQSKEKEARETLETVLWNMNLTKQETVKLFLQRYDLVGRSLFVFDGPDEHIRQALYTRSPSWVENPKHDSAIWNLKWCATDCDEDYTGLRDGDLYNHFQGNRALTTKSGLMQTLQELKVGSQVEIDAFFPRCYNMSQATEREDFVLDFRRSVAVQILRQHLRLTSAQPDRACGTYSFNANVLQVAIRAVEAWTADLDAAHVEEETAGVRSINEQEWDALLAYYELDDSQLRGLTCEVSGEPMKGTQCVPNGSIPRDARVGRGAQRSRNVQEWPEFAQQCWSTTPCVQQTRKIVDALGVLEALGCSPQMELQGPANAWVVKPGTNSKGSGVCCMNVLPKILHHCGTISNRLVQKYIERPLLLFGGRKFDIRQWVLVRSFIPLEAYMFSDCYLRLCCEPFCLRDLANRHRHVSNWTVNKSGKHVTDGAVISLAGFKAELFSITGQASYWDDVVRPKIQSIILHCLTAAQHRIVQRSASFEVYGFDFTIDEMLRPWLLEVNLSPACEARAPWMASMLKRMASRLFDIVLDGRCDPDGKEPDWRRIESTDNNGSVVSPTGLVSADRASVKCRPDLQGAPQTPAKAVDVLRSPEFGDAAVMPTNTSDLTIVGRAVNMRTERRFDAVWRRLHASSVLQRVGKGFLQRKRLRRARIAAAVIQRAWRYFRAVRRSVRVIQPRVRLWLVRCRKARKHRHEAALEMQRHARRHLARNLLVQTRLASHALSLQRCWRAYRGRALAAALRSRCQAVTRIQRTWHRHAQKRRELSAIVLIQADVRRYMAIRRFRKMLMHVWQPARQLSFVLSFARWRRFLRHFQVEQAASVMQRAWRTNVQVKMQRRLLTELRAARQTAAIAIQRRWRGHVARVRRSTMKLACVQLQGVFRRHLRKRERVWRCRQISAAITVQRAWRTVARRKTHHRDIAATRIQKAWRGMSLRQSLRYRRRLADRQHRWRAELAQREHENERDFAVLCAVEQQRTAAAVELQRRWRGFLVRSHYASAGRDGVELPSESPPSLHQRREPLVSSRQMRAARRIQLWWRGVQMVSMRRRAWAAVRIQVRTTALNEKIPQPRLAPRCFGRFPWRFEHRLPDLRPSGGVLAKMQHTGVPPLSPCSASTLPCTAAPTSADNSAMGNIAEGLAGAVGHSPRGPPATSFRTEDVELFRLPLVELRVENVRDLCLVASAMADQCERGTCGRRSRSSGPAMQWISKESMHMSRRVSERCTLVRRATLSSPSKNSESCIGNRAV